MSPGVADLGLYTIEVTYTSDFDGMTTSSLKVKLHVLKIYRTEIGSGMILN
jgi:stringent starvation protein B